MENKGIIVAVIIAIVAVIIGVSSLFDFSSGDNLQGMIQKVENHTDSLQ